MNALRAILIFALASQAILPFAWADEHALVDVSNPSDDSTVNYPPPYDMPTDSVSEPDPFVHQSRSPSPPPVNPGSPEHPLKTRVGCLGKKIVSPSQSRSVPLGICKRKHFTEFVVMQKGQCQDDGQAALQFYCQ